MRAALAAALVLAAVALPVSASAATVSADLTARTLTCAPEAAWVAGSFAISYGWTLDGVPIEGATQATIAITRSGTYVCTITGIDPVSATPVTDVATTQVSSTYSADGWRRYQAGLVGFVTSANKLPARCKTSTRRGRRATERRCALGYGRTGAAGLRIAEAMHRDAPFVAGACFSASARLEGEWRGIARAFRSVARDLVREDAAAVRSDLAELRHTTLSTKAFTAACRPA